MKKILLGMFILVLFSSAQSAVVIQPSNLTTFEDGSAVTYRVFLDSTPSVGEIVTLTPNSGDVTEGSVSGALVFDSSNFDQPQSVTVTPGASGDGNDGDIMYNITNNVSSNQGGGNYGGMVITQSTSVTNANIDGVQIITVDPSSGFFVPEGGNQIITFALNTAPAADVSIDISTVSTEISLSTATVVLTAGNSYSSTVTVTALDDLVVDGDLPFTITTDPAISMAMSFSGFDPVDINGFALDNDVVAAIPPTPVPGLNASTIILLILMISLFGSRLFSYQCKV